MDVAGEPEARRVARAKRLAEQQRRIAEQVAAQQAAAVAEAAAKEQRGSIRDQLKPRIEQWQAGKKVRASNTGLCIMQYTAGPRLACDNAFAMLFQADTVKSSGIKPHGPRVCPRQGRVLVIHLPSPWGAFALTQTC